MKKTGVTILVQPDGNTNFQPDGKKTGAAITLLLFLVVFSVAFYAYLKSQNVNIDSINLKQIITGGIKNNQVRTVREAYEIPYDIKERPVFGVYKDNIVKCSVDGIKLFDKKGTEVWTEGVSLNKPVVKTNGTDLLVADIGGMDIYVINGQ